MRFNQLCYQAENNRYRLQVFWDEQPENPRDWDNIGKMVFWVRGYILGDSHNFRTNYDFWKYLLDNNQNYTDWVYQYALKHGVIVDNKVIVPYNDIDKCCGVYYDCKDKEIIDIFCYLAEEILDDDSVIYSIADCRIWDKINEIIQEKYVILPLAFCNYNGSISVGSLDNIFDEEYDGYIYASKEKLLKETGYTANELFNPNPHRIPRQGEGVRLVDDVRWGQVICVNGEQFIINISRENILVNYCDIAEIRYNKALEILEGEVKIYSEYLTGEVYNIVLDEVIDGEYIDKDSYWGFYGDLYDLKKELINDGFNRDLIDNLQGV